MQKKTPKKHSVEFIHWLKKENIALWRCSSKVRSKTSVFRSRASWFHLQPVDLEMLWRDNYKYLKSLVHL